ncbi:TPA: hypothetical protein ACSP0P_003690 [Citrobacter freundii]
MSHLKHKNYFLIKIAIGPDDFISFTVKSLVARLLQLNDDAKRLAGNRKAIYTMLVAMVRSGELCKKVATNPRESTYHKTPKFSSLEACDISKLNEFSEPLSSIAKSSDENERTIKYLESRLKEHQISLMASIGESEEYKTLFTTLPDMHLQLEELFIRSREKSSTLLGQIAAINNVISQCKSCPVL